MADPPEEPPETPPINNPDLSVKHGRAGRPTGAINRRSAELAKLLAERGDTDPAEYLSKISSGKIEGIDHQMRITASIALMPYLHARRHGVPSPVYTADPRDISPPSTMADVKQ
jgi:hypothetical protein